MSLLDRDTPFGVSTVKSQQSTEFNSVRYGRTNRASLLFSTFRLIQSSNHKGTKKTSFGNMLNEVFYN